MSSMIRRIQQKGTKIGVHNEVKPTNRAPRGSRRGTHKKPWRGVAQKAIEAFKSGIGYSERMALHIGDGGSAG